MKKIETLIYSLDFLNRLTPKTEMLTLMELSKLKSQARQNAISNTDWNNITKGWNHILYYADKQDEDGIPYYATVYLNNYALQDCELEKVAKNASGVGALHRK